MSVNFTLRPAIPGDAGALQKSCWPDRGVEVVEELLQRVDGITRRGRGMGIVAEVDYQVVGYAQITLWSRTGEISDLIVAARLRSQGIGSAMILYLIEKARSWSVPRVELGVAMTNPRALSLYRHLGFKDDRLINLDLGSGPEAVTYLVMPLDSKQL